MDPGPGTAQDRAVTERDADELLAGALCLGLPLVNTVVAALPWHREHYAAANLALTAGLLGAARTRGLDAGELGLSRAALPDGLRAGGAIAAALAAALGAGLASGRTRTLLHDARVAELTLPEVVTQAAVRIPVGTALFEETAYRGVLLAVLRRRLPGRRAALVGSAVFGLSHVRPALEANRLNGRGSPAAEVLGTVAATGLAGLGLAWLRERTGSLAAPLVVHAAANSLATVAAAAAARLGAGAPAPRDPRPD